MSAVSVCRICDIADCAHIREPVLKARIADLAQQVEALQAELNAQRQSEAITRQCGAEMERQIELQKAISDGFSTALVAAEQLEGDNAK